MAHTTVSVEMVLIGIRTKPIARILTSAKIQTLSVMINQTVSMLYPVFHVIVGMDTKEWDYMVFRI